MRTWTRICFVLAVLSFGVLVTCGESQAAVRVRVNPNVVQNRIDRNYNQGYRQGARAVNRSVNIVNRGLRYRTPYVGRRYIAAPGVRIGF